MSNILAIELFVPSCKLVSAFSLVRAGCALRETRADRGRIDLRGH